MKMMLESLQNMFRENPLRSFLSLFALVAGSFLLGSAWGIADGLERLLKAAEGEQGLIITLANGTVSEDGTYSRTLPPEFTADISDLVQTAMPEASALSPVTQTPFNRLLVDGKQFQVRRVSGVASAYPEIMGLTLTDGQIFTEEDVDNKKPVAVISSELAEAFYGSSAAAIGKTFETVMMGRQMRTTSTAAAGASGGTSAGSTTQAGRNREIPRQQFTVVGVFKTPSTTFTNRYAIPDIMLPYTASSPGGFQIPASFYWGSTVLNVKGSSLETARVKLQEALVAEYGDIDVAVWQGNPNNPDLSAETTGKSLRSLVFLVSGLGLILVLVSGVGMFGIMTVEVAGRSKQYGIRRALGADMGHIYSLVAGQAAAMGLVGAIIGLGLAMAVNLPVLHGLSPWFEKVGLESDIVFALGLNGLPFALALLAITGSSTIFGVLPVLRIQSTTPVMLLREESA